MFTSIDIDTVSFAEAANGLRWLAGGRRRSHRSRCRSTPTSHADSRPRWGWRCARGILIRWWRGGRRGFVWHSPKIGYI